MTRLPIKEVTRGRWRSILPQFGVSADFLINRHGPCPLCREGKDRFRFDDKDGDGTWICNSCGAGDGTKLVMLMKGWDFVEAAKEIQVAVEGAPIEAVKARRSDDQRRQAMNNLWLASRPICPDDPAGQYLLARCGPRAAFPGDLRFAPECRYYLGPKEFVVHPALLARIRAQDGRPVNIHRTYLTAQGRKAPYEDPRRLMEGELPKGCAIRLCAAKEALGAAEGMETALSATALFGEPCWATVTADNLAAWSPPDGVTRAPVFADNDASFTGQAAGYTLARRLRAKRIETDVLLPPTVGEDWNDVHMASLPSRLERAA